MTYQEIIDLANTYNDDYANPWINDTRAAKLVYDSYLEFIKEKVAEIEATERITDDLMPVIRTAIFPTASTLNLTGVVSNFYLTALLRGKFRNLCHANPNAVMYRVITHKPLQGVGSTDPFEKPTNEFPTYYAYSTPSANLYVVESETAPIKTTLFYVIEPVKPTVADLSTLSPETLSITHPEIAKILMRKFTYTTEDQRYPYAENEIAQEQ